MDMQQCHRKRRAEGIGMYLFEFVKNDMPDLLRFMLRKISVNGWNLESIAFAASFNGIYSIYAMSDINIYFVWSNFQYSNISKTILFFIYCLFILCMCVCAKCLSPTV